MSNFSAINTALKGMMAAQTALDVTSNNIANTNTEGYTRQRVTLVESNSISGLVQGAQLGSGVDVADVTRIRDTFIDYQIRNETSTLEYESTISDTLSNVESLFMEPSDTGLNKQLDTFWNAWQDVAATPESTSVRTVLKENAVSLTDRIRQTSDQLSAIQDDIQSQIDLDIEDVNSISKRIAKLNTQIEQSVSRGETPNNFMDARDLLVDKLSALGNITVTNLKDGTGEYTGVVKVKLGDLTIVDENGANEIDSAAVSSSTITDGSLGALMKLGGSGDTANTVQYYIDKLNTLAVGIAKSVNDIHTTGKDLDGTSGEDFFVFKDEDGNVITTESDFAAGNIYVNPDIEDDVSKIAASQDADLEGNGDIALQIGNLKDTKLTYDSTNKVLNNSGTGTITIGDFYQDMVTELGSQVSEAKSNISNQQTLVDNLTTKKESNSGVSVDEETANTVLYQHAFSACAKIISVIDEMLDTIINNMKA